MNKFEIGKVYKAVNNGKIRIVTISKNDICFNRVCENENGDFVNTVAEAEIVKIKKDKEGNEIIRLADYNKTTYQAEKIIDEAEFKKNFLEKKAAKEQAEKDEAERIANAPEMAFGSSIDFTELFNYIKEFTGHSNLTFTKPTVECSCRNYWSIKWESSNIDSSELGVFGKILKSCVVAPFNNQISKDENGNCRYWATVHIHYQHINGGSNGMELFTARFEDGTWRFDNRV